MPRWFRWSGRIRGFVSTGGVLAILVGVLAPLPKWPTLVLALGGLAAIVAGLVLTLHPGAPRIGPRELAAPVTGRWIGFNSPADKVPSHGTHGHGQTYAIDLVYEPEPGARPAFGDGTAFRPPTDFPGFGQPIRAPADGRVVAARNTSRDHRSRSSWSAYAFMMVEGMFRELTGSRHVVGNHVVIDLGDGGYAALAHLQRGSVTVRPGDVVRKHDVIGRCGNSGNTSEPHLHLQVMDHRWPFIAAGLPFTLVDVEIDGTAATTGLPANDAALRAS